MYRFDFKNKKEIYLKRKETGKFSFFQSHPLLLNHNESMHELFLNSKPELPNKFINDIEYCIVKIIQGFRNWKDYIEIDTGINYDIFLQNLHKGSGKLMKLPYSIIREIQEISENHKVKTKYFGEKIFFQNQLIMINNQYIIAEEFKLSLV